MFPPSIDLNVSEKLKRDPEFRQRFFVAESSAEIARQLIALRKRRGLSQVQLAEKLGTQQPAISRVESADYRNWSYNTLRKEAEVLDARLRVLIEPAEDILKEYETEAVEYETGSVEQPTSTSKTSATINVNTVISDIHSTGGEPVYNFGRSDSLPGTSGGVVGAVA
jgi:transcriptional regulator with XRE-family HTH domain